MKQWSKALVFILAMAILLAACGADPQTDSPTDPAQTPDAAPTGAPGAVQPNGEPERPTSDRPVSSKDTLIIAHEQDSTDMDIHGSTTNTTLKIKSQVYEPLIEQTVEGEFLPALATQWEYIDDAATLQLTLRDGVKFHNGETMSAEDVLFSLEVASQSGQSMPVENIDFEKSYCPDEKTVVLYQKVIQYDLVYDLSMPMAAIFSKKGYEEGNGNWANMDIGTGPYMWGEWVPGDHQDLHAFEDYWDEGYPLIKNITFKVIVEGTNRDIELETASCDMAYNCNVNDIPNLKANEKLYVYEELVPDNSIFGFNNTSEIWSNSDLHKAFKWAFDVDSAWELSMNGTGLAAHSFCPPNVKGYLGEDRGYTTVGYDLDKAKEFLKAAGYENGISCEFLVANNPVRLDIATFWANSLKQIGVDLQINILDGATISQRLKVEGTFDAFMWGSGATNGHIDYLMRHYDKDTSASLAVCRWQNQEFADIIDKAIQAQDEEQMYALYDQAQKLLFEHYPAIPLYTQQDTYAMVKELKGVKDGL